MMEDYVAARMAQIFLLVVLGIGVIGFVQDFLL
jgi:hypothetical protein